MDVGRKESSSIIFSIWILPIKVGLYNCVLGKFHRKPILWLIFIDSILPENYLLIILFSPNNSCVCARWDPMFLWLPGNFWLYKLKITCTKFIDMPINYKSKIHCKYILVCFLNKFYLKCVHTYWKYNTLDIWVWVKSWMVPMHLFILLNFQLDVCLTCLGSSSHEHEH